MAPSVLGLPALIAALALLLFPSCAAPGFDTSRSSIPVDEIVSGGPPKDGIPAILGPKFLKASEVNYLAAEDEIVGVVVEGVARAYPLRVLNWHEAVNDRVGSVPIAVTYCPLTRSAVVYDRRVNGRPLSFGISGRLYQSNVLLYDHQTESLWSQLREEAVTGPQTGARLQTLPAITTTWAAWRRAHPDTLVLSFDTGHRRDYAEDPYADYARSPALMFPPKRVDARLPAKEIVLGVRIGGAATAYPLASLARAGSVDDEVGGRGVHIEYDAQARSLRSVTRDEGRPVTATTMYWFAWAAFHPDTALWKPSRQLPGDASPPAGGAEGSAAVVIVSHDAAWTSAFGFGWDPGTGGADLLLIRGQLRNRSERPLDHVRLVFELLDREGRVMAAEEGYNRASETLRVVESPVPIAEGPAVARRAIPRGGADGFRMMFAREELPAFAAYRIRVLESPAAQ